MNFNINNFDHIFESVGIAAMAFNADAVVTACTSASEKLLGLPVGGVVGRRLSELGLRLVDADGSPERSDRFPLNKIAGNREKAGQFDFGRQMARINGMEWFRARCQTTFTGGCLSSLTLTLTGITDLVGEKITQNQIVLAKREWEATVDALQDLVTIQDKEMRIIRANKTAHELFGYELGQLKGERCYEVFHHRTSPCAECPARQSEKNQRSHTATVYNSVLDKTFSVSSFPVFDLEGQLYQFVHVARDITREELLEQQLHQAVKMEALGTLAGGIAHDFNNILAAIIGYGEMARGRLAADHPARRDLDQVIAGGDRAVDLVRQILTFSRRESYGQFRLVRLQQVIKEVIQLLRPTLPATIELQHAIDDSCRAAFADPGQIYQVLMNLCTNARQAIGDGHGRITIGLAERCSSKQREGDSGPAEEAGVLLDLEVSDTGCGIDEAILGKIFDPFFTTKKKQQGTGLGLAVVHGIVKKHKGEIHVASKVGVGTTVHVYLAANDGRVDDKKTALAGQAGGCERIMVIDDEPTLTELLRMFLGEAGYQVTTFCDSIAAVKQFRNNPDCCDLVITDMLMPDMTGAELAREFLGQRPDIPIIILTGHSENFDRLRAKQLGVRELLLKPVKKEKLYQVVRRVLEDGKNLDH